MRRVVLWAAFVLALAFPARADVLVTDAWARATAGSGRTGAVYLVLANTGPAADRLVSISSEVAGGAELHATVQEGTVMRMRHVDDVALAPGASVALEPGGLHVMLTDLAGPLKRGTSFPLTLRFERRGTVTVEVEVRGPGATSHGH